MLTFFSLLCDKEEEKTVKGIKNIAESNKRRYVIAEEEVEFLKGEIEKLNDEIDNKLIIKKKMKNT